jgi:hypothetical protein
VFQEETEADGEEEEDGKELNQVVHVLVLDVVRSDRQNNTCYGDDLYQNLVTYKL